MAKFREFSSKPAHMHFLFKQLVRVSALLIPLLVATRVQALRGGTIVRGHPGAVEIKFRGDGSCTGSMISRTLILTAAHCLGQGILPSIRSGINSGVIIGTVMYYDPELGRRQVFNGTLTWFAPSTFTKWVTRSTGSRGVGSDYAILRATSPFSDTDTTDFLRILDSEDLFPPIIRTTGKFPGIVRTGTVQTFGVGIFTYSGRSDDKLRITEFFVPGWSDERITIDNRKRVSICKGDSGGPVLVSPNGVPAIAGVHSLMWIGAQGPILGESALCTNNDLNDNSWASRTHWSRIQQLIRQAAPGLLCEIDLTAPTTRRCFPQLLPALSPAWISLPGTATDATDGWIIGTDRREGGFGIYRSVTVSSPTSTQPDNTRPEWERIPGGAVRIGGTHNRPWIVNNRNNIYQWDGSTWIQRDGFARDIGDGWIVGTDSRPGGFGIYRWNGNNWDRVPGGAVRIGGTFDKPLIVNNAGIVFAWDSRRNRWIELPGAPPARDVGDEWIIGTRPRPGGFQIVRQSGILWSEVPGGAESIGGSKHDPYIVNSSGQVYRLD
jgi:hypothetical protein